MSLESRAISNVIQGKLSQLDKEGKSQRKIGREKVESVAFGQRFGHDATYASASVHGGWESHAIGDRLPSAANVAARSYVAPKRVSA